MPVASPPAPPAAPPPAPLRIGTLDHYEAWARNLTLPPKATEKKTGGRRRGAGMAGARQTIEDTHAAARPNRGGKPAPIPLVMEPFQLRVLEDYFDGCAETFVMLPKGNAKSMLAAALALYHLCYVDEAEAYIFAASRDQAHRLLNAAAGFVRRSPVLQKHLLLRLGSREIRSRRDGGSLKVLAADPATADGIGPTLVICDELHRWRTLEPYTLAKEGLGKRDGQLIGISTAGEDENDPFGIMRAVALRHLELQEGAYKYAPAPSGEFVWHEWSLAPTDDITDMELVKSANPLAQITIQSLRDRYDSPGTRRAWWARFVCGIWTRDDDAAISAMDWAPNQVAHCRIPDGAAGVIIGLDFGWRKDTTAMVPTWRMNDDPLTLRVDERLEILTPPGGGISTSDETIWASVTRLSKLWPAAVFVADPNANAEHICQRIERELGHVVVYQAQDHGPMAHATSIVMELVRTKRLEHPGRADYSSQVLAAYLAGRDDKQRFVQGSGGSPVDAVVATSMAARQHHVAVNAPKPAAPFVMSG
jgi:hypothetical protein